MGNLTEKQKKVSNITSIAGSAGLVLGLGYAFMHKKKFWGYVGFGLLGGIITSVGAGVISNIMIKETTTTPPAPSTEGDGTKKAEGSPDTLRKNMRWNGLYWEHVINK